MTFFLGHLRFWTRSLIGKTPACHAGDSEFDPRRVRQKIRLSAYFSMFYEICYLTELTTFANWSAPTAPLIGVAPFGPIIIEVGVPVIFATRAASR